MSNNTSVSQTLQFRFIFTIRGINNFVNVQCKFLRRYSIIVLFHRRWRKAGQQARMKISNEVQPKCCMRRNLQCLNPLPLIMQWIDQIRRRPIP